MGATDQVQQADGPKVRPSDFRGPATRTRERRSLQRARAFSAAQPSRRMHTSGFLAVLVLGLVAVFATGAVTNLVSADDHPLRLPMTSLPGLPAASTAVYPLAASTARVDAYVAAYTSVPTPAPEPEATSTAAASLAAALPTAAAEASPTHDATSNATVEPTATPAPTEDSAQRSTALSGTSSAPSAPAPLYVTYTVQAGDTVSGIAQAFGVRTQDIVANNIGIISGQSLLVVGATLQVPAAPGVLHAVHVGETLADIADAYGVTLEDIVGFPGNRITDPSAVLEGQVILVVNGTAPFIASSGGGASSAAEAATAEPTAEPTPEPTPEPPPQPRFIWPVVGPITSYFGPSHPKGIDISIAYAPVAASAAGKVVFVGGDPCCSYGYYIDIQHADGYLTRYGHLSRFMVKLGQQVQQGDTIAISGNTGYSTGAHVHFEIQLGGAYVNPLDYLP